MVDQTRPDQTTPDQAPPPRENKKKSQTKSDRTHFTNCVWGNFNRLPCLCTGLRNHGFTANWVSLLGSCLITWPWFDSISYTSFASTFWMMVYASLGPSCNVAHTNTNYRGLVKQCLLARMEEWCRALPLSIFHAIARQAPVVADSSVGAITLSFAATSSCSRHGALAGLGVLDILFLWRN